MFIYFALICVSGALWYLFYPDSNNLPDNICSSNGRYFISDKKGKKVVVSGNFRYITLRFGERLVGPLLKLISTIRIYTTSE